MSRDVLSLTERLVAVDTAPGRSTADAAALLADELSALGAHVTLQRGEHGGVEQHNLVARFGGAGPAGLVLAGHLDTVPWDDSMRARATPERDGRRLYGRGTCDMKGPIAAMVEAAASRVERLARPLILVGTYAEEVGCRGALQLTADARALGDLRDAVCLVGEPTGLTPIVAHKGYAVATLELHGEPAHSSDPWAGADVSVALGVLLRELEGLRERLRVAGPPDSPHRPPCTTLNTGLIQSGTAANVVPDRARVSLEWRPLPGEDAVALQAAVQACLDTACAARPGVAARLHWPESLPAFHQPAASEVVRFCEQATGQAPGVVPFYTEAELYRAGLALPTVVCGPGSIARAHRVDECIDFDELEAGVAFYAAAIERFCG